MAAKGLANLAGRTELEAALKGAIEAARPLALAMLDVDNLSVLNGEHGPEAGDRALDGLVGVLAEATAGPIYRIAGDEFALLLPELTLEQAFLAMEDLRRRVEAAGKGFGLPADWAMTIGIGVAQYPRDAKTVRGLFSAADAALGSAKDGGSNQVGLPPNEEMVMKSCYYPEASLRRLAALADRLGRKQSPLLREALEDLFRKYDKQTG